jgi:hypothetical protein
MEAAGDKERGGNDRKALLLRDEETDDWQFEHVESQVVEDLREATRIAQRLDEQLGLIIERRCRVNEACRVWVSADRCSKCVHILLLPTHVAEGRLAILGPFVRLLRAGICYTSTSDRAKSSI